MQHPGALPLALPVKGKRVIDALGLSGQRKILLKVSVSEVQGQSHISSPPKDRQLLQSHQRPGLTKTCRKRSPSTRSL